MTPSMTASALLPIGYARIPDVLCWIPVYENCDYEEGSGEPTFLWTKHNVDILTEQWPRVQEIRGKIDHLVEWLEQDQISRFRELLDFLLKTEPVKTKKRRKRRDYDPSSTTAN